MARKRLEAHIKHAREVQMREMGARICQAMDLCGADADTVSDLIGVSTSSIYKWAEGSTRPLRENLVSFARATWTNAGWLIHGREGLTDDEAFSLAEERGIPFRSVYQYKKDYDWPGLFPPAGRR